MADLCSEFHTNPSINPRSGRRIEIGGPTYKALVKQCGPPNITYPIVNVSEMSFPQYVQQNTIPKPIIPRIPSPTPTISRTSQLPTLIPITIIPAITPKMPVQLVTHQHKGTTMPITQRSPGIPPIPTATFSPYIGQMPLPKGPIIPTLNMKLPTNAASPSVTRRLNINEVNGVWGVAQRQQRAGEDRYQAKQIGPYRYFAVFDGHGGTRKMGRYHVADYAVEHLHEKIAEYLGNIDLNNQREVISEISRAIVDLDDEMYNNNLLYGSTCTLVLIDDERNIIYQVNVGDSKSIIFNQGIISATVNHDPDDPEEETRIEAANGYVYGGRVMGILAVSRAFGDFDLKGKQDDNYHPIDGMVSALPDIKVIQINHQRTIGPKYIILTSDAPYERDAFNDDSLVSLFYNINGDSPVNTPDKANIIAATMVQTIFPRTTDDTTILLVSI